MRCRFGLLLACAGLGSFAQAVTLFSPDTFADNSTGAWSGNMNMTTPTGGADGASDRYLRVVSSSQSSSGQKMAIKNLSDKFTGDYLAAGVTGIRLSMRNFGTSTFSMRLVLIDSGQNRWTTNDAIIVAPSSTWQTYTFQIAPTTMTKVLDFGGATYQSSLADVTQMLLRHQSGAPAMEGQALAGTMGFDNIEVVPEPASLMALGIGAAALMKQRKKR